MWTTATDPSTEELALRDRELQDLIQKADAKVFPKIGEIKVPPYATYHFRHASTAELEEIDPNLVFYLDANDVTFSQYWVTNTNGNYMENIKQTIQNKPQTLPPCAVIYRDGYRWVSLDNRRLNEFKKANQRIPCRVATNSEIDNAFKKEKELNGIKESPTIIGNLTINPCYQGQICIAPNLEAKAKEALKINTSLETFCLNKKEIAYQMVMENNQNVTEIASALNMSRATIYRYIDQRKQLVIG